jgi:hypothetical protein
VRAALAARAEDVHNGPTMKCTLVLLAVTGGIALAQSPSITAILNNYSLINPGSVAQRAIFIVKGSNLSAQTTTLQNVPLQTTLRGVQTKITVAGTTTLAPLYSSCHSS